MGFLRMKGVMWGGEMLGKISRVVGLGFLRV